MKIKDFIIFLLAILIVTFVIALGAIGLYLYNEAQIEQKNIDRRSEYDRN